MESQMRNLLSGGERGGENLVIVANFQLWLLWAQVQHGKSDQTPAPIYNEIKPQRVQEAAEDAGNWDCPFDCADCDQIKYKEIIHLARRSGQWARLHLMI